MTESTKNFAASHNAIQEGLDKILERIGDSGAQTKVFAHAVRRL
jgi:hypothetical protein